MQHIVAIGGGEIRELETLPIDSYIVDLARKPGRPPRALFIPTASDDSEDYCRAFSMVYETRLGCEVDYLLLLSGATDHVEKIGRADLVYVGGGNTPKMIRLWREGGVDVALRRAWEEGVVMCGLSAGANCWMRHANTDAPRIENRPGPLTERMDGLDFLPLTLCPHMAREEYRLTEFTQMMKDLPGIGVGLDDGCALHVCDDRYRLLSCIEGATAHKISWDGATAVHERICPSDEFRPLSELYV